MANFWIAEIQTLLNASALILPDAPRAMSKRADSKVLEVKDSHAIYVSQPEAVAALIKQAASAKAKAA